jgi:DNA repair protein RadA/Sms
MARARSSFVCQSCDYRAQKWLGRCPRCNEWNSLVEEIADAGPAGRDELDGATTSAEPASLAEIEERPAVARLGCGIAEVDRVLGGGLVPGSVVLLGGEPGIGKSTLLCQMLDGIAAAAGDSPVLCVSGEESVAQTALRARRVGVGAANLRFVAETNLERVVAHLKKLRPPVMAIDSIQTMYSCEVDSIPGSVGQVRECASRLLQIAKQHDIATVLVGHVTKDGNLAGPKVLEHLVDVVLSFDGEGGSSYRILRGQKNRFGSTAELGVFEMGDGGLREVANPSELFLAERPIGAPGSVVVASAEGSRPILVEIQALVAPPSAGVGRRTAAGVDGKRVALLLAVLAQRAGCDVLSRDVFVNVAGGARLSEPAVDLGVACAVASSASGRACDGQTAVFGEVGLAGEVRAVSLAPTRLAEAAKLGFHRCLVPAQNAAQLTAPPGIELIPIGHLREALERL